MHPSFLEKSDSESYRCLMEWWHWLRKDKNFDNEFVRNNRFLETTSELITNAARAKIRRADTLEKVIFEPYFQKLYQELIKAKYKVSIEKLACMAHVLAWVQDDITLPAHATNMAALFAKPSDEHGDRPPISPIRFQKLLELDNEQELANLLRRFVQMMKKQAHVTSLANGAYHWLWSANVRKNWAIDYYAFAPGNMFGA